MSAKNHGLTIVGGDRPSRLRGLKEINTSESPDEPEVVSQTEESGSSSIVSAYLGLGSNLGDRESNLRQAIDHIRSLGLVIVRSSSIYETEPVGYTDQPWFLNQVIELETPTETFRQSRERRKSDEDVQIAEAEGLLKEERRDQSSEQLVQAEALLRELLDVEAAMGRARCVPNGPRVIDIDLLLFGELIVGSGSNPADRHEEIRVPHPRMHLRRFVLEPLCEIAPDLVHPILKRTCRELLAAVDDRAVVRTYA